MKTKVQPSHSIHQLLFMTAKQAQRGVERLFIKEKIGITPLQFGVLRSIPENGSTLNDLARRMMFKPPSILPSIDLLERRGCVTRRNDPHDRRKIHIFATAKGKKVVERIVSSRKLDSLGAAFRNMASPKKKKLLALLAELNAKMSKD